MNSILLTNVNVAIDSAPHDEVDSVKISFYFGLPKCVARLKELMVWYGADVVLKGSRVERVKEPRLFIFSGIDLDA